MIVLYFQTQRAAVLSRKIMLFGIRAFSEVRWLHVSSYIFKDISAVWEDQIVHYYMMVLGLVLSP